VIQTQHQYKPNKKIIKISIDSSSGAARVVRDPEDPLSSVAVEEFNKELAVNITSAVVTAQEAVRGFKELPSSASRTFIETGNKLNTIAIPKVFAFGIGKTASAHMIHCASIAYRPQGFK
jgi:hypothetical protein